MKLKCRVIYYDVGNCYVDTKEFVVDSNNELKEKSIEYAKALVNEGYEIAGWNYGQIKEDF